MIKLRVFVSSVQKELANERRAAQTLITSDPFLDKHSVPILYEDEPSMLRPAPLGYLDDLAKCQIYPQPHRAGTATGGVLISAKTSATIRNRHGANPQRDSVTTRNGQSRATAGLSLLMLARIGG